MTGADRIPRNELRLKRLAERIHRLGPAPLFYLLREIEDGADLMPTLERYAALDGDFIRAFSGDRFTVPFVLVVGERAA